MKRVTAVIGANYGDEGKGLTTDWLASQGPSVVVRYNGGAQAGHTVMTPEGKRHVFGHFGAGSFLRAKTYLSSYFIVNPILFARELRDMSFLPQTYVDQHCLVTTPYDMMINQMLEEKRGGQRHGSCGAGINETVVRSATPHRVGERNPFLLRVADLVRPNKIDLIRSIRNNYIPQRLQALGLPPLTEEYKSDDVLLRFVADCDDFLSKTHRVYNEGLKRFHEEQIIFEGAQGLRLDEHHRNFPHVTRSKTGMYNILHLALEADIKEIEVYYPTRTYLTRHGAGPLENELQEMPFAGIEDLTNKPNRFQGSLRFAHLDIDDLTREIDNDAQSAPKFGINIVRNMIVTCVDQLPALQATYYDNGKKVTTFAEEMLESIKNKTRAKELHYSVGPRRQDVYPL